MERRKQELQSWRFQVDHNAIGEDRAWYQRDHDKSGWMSVECPQAWDFYQEAFWGFEGIGWYAAELHRDWVDTASLQRICFHSVSGYCKVWVNGEYLGEHIGSYLPFEFAITSCLLEGQDNEIVIRVDNRAREDWLPGSPLIEWVQYGGILQKVILETTDFTYLSSLGVRTEQQKDRALLYCDIELFNYHHLPFEGELELNLPDGNKVYTKVKRVSCEPGSDSKVRMTVELPEAKLWDLNCPHLYTLTANLYTRDTLIDSKRERFGVRTIEVSGSDILLNGRKLQIKGVNRYDEYAGYGPTVPESVIREDLMTIKNMGANLVRVHYPQDPVHLDIMDEIGLLMMEEIPLNWWLLERNGEKREFYPQVIDMAEEALENLIRRDNNHPCVIAWSMCNESGTNTEIGIQSMRRLMKRAKQLDSTRLVTFVAMGTPGHDAFHDADIVCINIYYGLFSGQVALEIDQLDKLVAQTTEEHLRRTALEYSGKPVVLTEFGTHGILGLKGKDRFSETYQAAYIECVWKAMQNSGIQGGVLWAWADYYHRRDFVGTDGIKWNSAYGPYGIVTVDRRKKEAFYTLTKLFGGK